MAERDPAKLARTCFQIAADERSPAGERAAALNRGMALLDRHKLNPDHFAIPGRERPRVQEFDLNVGPSPSWDSGRSPWAEGFEYAEAMRGAGVAFSMDDLVREAVRESMRRRRERAKAEGEKAAREKQQAQHFAGVDVGPKCRHGVGRMVRCFRCNPVA